jgi:hypothetical protein
MRKVILTLGLLILCASVKAQIDAGSVMGMPSGTTAQITAITTAPIGSCAYSTDEETIYWYTSTGWVSSTDDQDASEVDLVTAVDADGDSANESTVEDVVQAITPITSASGRIFYPPSIAIDASTNGDNRTINLYTEYINQFGSGNTNLVRSIDGGVTAPNIPTYAANELYYYVTYYDPNVFSDISIDGATGIMTYDIDNQPTDYNSLINVVFVVK